MIQMEMRKKDVDNILRKVGTDNFFPQGSDAGTGVNDGNPVCSFTMDPYTGRASPVSFKFFAAYGQRTPHSVKFDFHLPTIEPE
jgi:hypothetical protein